MVVGETDIVGASNSTVREKEVATFDLLDGGRRRRKRERESMHVV